MYLGMCEGKRKKHKEEEAKKRSSNKVHGGM